MAPSNTGLPSGFDLNNDGAVTLGNDALGFGEHAGQYSFVVYSKHPIETDQVRTFQNFLWKDMPDAKLFEDDPDGRTLFDPEAPFDPHNPDDTSTSFFTEEEIEVVRLSSKNHADVPVNVDGEIIHILASHPTPPTFDGVEDWNGKRNFDEVRLWKDYINGENYLVDDNGVAGGLPEGARFVIMGDQNADPLDGESVEGAAAQIIDDPKVIGSQDDATITPASEGARVFGDGDKFDTADFSETEDETGEVSRDSLRVDYVLPSKAGFEFVDGKVVWPADENDPINDPSQTSDHRMVVVDLELTSTEPQTVTDIEYLGRAVFDTETEFQGTLVGGLSSITYDAQNNLYYTISDDQSDYRFYTVQIDLSDGTLEDGDVNFVATTLLRDANGIPFADGVDDIEGIALTEDNTLLVTSEGFATGDPVVDPAIYEFALSGDQIGELYVAPKFGADPFGEFGVRGNLAFENATITPDGNTFYTATENALIQDGPAASPETGSPSRIVEYDLTTGLPVAEFVYENDPVPLETIPPGEFSVNGLVELLPSITRAICWRSSATSRSASHALELATVPSSSRFRRPIPTMLWTSKRWMASTTSSLSAKMFCSTSTN